MESAGFRKRTSWTISEERVRLALRGFLLRCFGYPPVGQYAGPISGVLYRWTAPGLLGAFVGSIETERCQIILEDYTDGDVLTAGIQTAPQGQAEWPGIRSSQDISVGSCWFMWSVSGGREGSATFHAIDSVPWWPSASSTAVADLTMECEIIRYRSDPDRGSVEWSGIFLYLLAP